MEKRLSIRHLYQPLQPTVQPGKRGIRYIEREPDLRLQELIYCYWELKTTHPLKKAFSYNVVADGCIDIFFDANNPSGNYLMGLTTTCTEFPVGTDFHFVGIRFLPAAFPQLFRLDASLITNRFEHLGNVVPGISSFISVSFDEHRTLHQIKSLLDFYFLNLLQKNETTPDYRISQALDIILKSGGNLTLKKDLNISLSSRHLRRLFKTYIGGGVKTFSKIVRFQNVLKTSATSGNLQGIHPVFEAGYYDQAHFIKEFKTFYGTTPGNMLRN